MMYYIRPNSAQEYYNIGAIRKNVIADDAKCRFRIAVPAATAALPQVSSVVQEYVSGDRFGETIVCSGTVAKQGDTYGILVDDTKAGETGSYAFSGEYLMLADAAATFTEMGDVYIITADMEVTHDATANDFIGKMLEEVTNPNALPAGTYWRVRLMQSEI